MSNHEAGELPGKGQVIGKAPTSVVVICATLIAISVIGSVVALSIVGKDANDLFRLLNLLFNAVTVLGSTGAMAYAGAAAKQSHKAVEQTNGSLDKRIEAGAARAVYNMLNTQSNVGMTQYAAGDPHSPMYTRDGPKWNGEPSQEPSQRQPES